MMKEATWFQQLRMIWGGEGRKGFTEVKHKRKHGCEGWEAKRRRWMEREGCDSRWRLYAEHWYLSLRKNNQEAGWKTRDWGGVVGAKEEKWLHLKTWWSLVNLSTVSVEWWGQRGKEVHTRCPVDRRWRLWEHGCTEQLALWRKLSVNAVETWKRGGRRNMNQRNGLLQAGSSGHPGESHFDGS